MLNALEKSNKKLPDRKILIQGHRHWCLVEKGKKETIKLAKKFEPNKEVDEITQKEVLEAMRSCWLALVDYVGTFYVTL